MHFGRRDDEECCECPRKRAPSGGARAPMKRGPYGYYYDYGEGEKQPLSATASVGTALSVVGGGLLFLRILQKLGGS